MVMDDPEPLHGVLDAYREAYRNARQQAWIERLGLDAWTEADEASFATSSTSCMLRRSTMFPCCATWRKA